MTWLALLLLCTPQGAGEEKGTYRLSFSGNPAGTESYRMESFDGGTVVLFSKSAFTAVVGGRDVRHTFDTVLTSGPGFAPVRYAGYHKAGRKERLSKLDWKKGSIIVDGKRRLKSAARYVLDDRVVAHYLPILRQEGGIVNVFDPSTLREEVVRIVRAGEVMLRGAGREIRVRECRLSVGTVRSTAHLDDAGRILRLEFGKGGMLAELAGFEGLQPGPIDLIPKGLEETAVRFPSGEDGAGGVLTRPKGEGPFPSVVLLGDAKDGTDCGGPALDLRSLARRLALSGLLVLRPERAEPGPAAAWLRARNDVSAVGLVGCGDGGRAAASEAARDSELGLLVLLSVPARPLEKVLLDRMDRQLRDQGTPDEARERILDRQRTLFNDIKAADGDYLEIDERRTFIGAIRERLTFDLPDTLGRIEAPVVMVGGEADACLDAEEGAQLSRALPDVRHVRLEGLGHGFGRPLDAGFIDRLAEIVRVGLE